MGAGEGGIGLGDGGGNVAKDGSVEREGAGDEGAGDVAGDAASEREGTGDIATC